jgi:hypothetical protein
MSQREEQHRQVVLILSQAFSKLCDVASKTFDENEQERDFSDVDLALAKIYIENSGILNMIQGEAHFEQVKGEKIVETNKIEVTVSDGAKISGNLVVAKSIENSFNRIDTSSASDELKTLLRDLSVAVEKMMEHLPKEERDDAAEDRDKLIEQAVQEKPKRKWWSVSVDGLSKAAENLGEIGKPVLDIVAQIVPLLTILSK